MDVRSCYRCFSVFIYDALLLIYIFEIMKLNRLYILSFLILVIMSTDAVAQCSMCRAVLESEQDKSVAEGINNGIVYLMAFPYLLVGGLGYYIYRTYRSNKAKS